MSVPSDWQIIQCHVVHLLVKWRVFLIDIPMFNFLTSKLFNHGKYGYDGYVLREFTIISYHESWHLNSDRTIMIHRGKQNWGGYPYQKHFMTPLWDRTGSSPSRVHLPRIGWVGRHVEPGPQKDKKIEKLLQSVPFRWRTCLNLFWGPKKIGGQNFVSPNMSKSQWDVFSRFTKDTS